MTLPIVIANRSEDNPPNQAEYGYGYLGEHVRDHDKCRSQLYPTYLPDVAREVGRAPFLMGICQYWREDTIVGFLRPNETRERSQAARRGTPAAWAVVDGLRRVHSLEGFSRHQESQRIDPGEEHIDKNST